MSLLFVLKIDPLDGVFVSHHFVKGESEVLASVKRNYTSATEALPKIFMFLD